MCCCILITGELLKRLAFILSAIAVFLLVQTLGQSSSRNICASNRLFKRMVFASEGSQIEVSSCSEYFKRNPDLDQSVLNKISDLEQENTLLEALGKEIKPIELYVGDKNNQTDQEVWKISREFFLSNEFESELFLRRLFVGDDGHLKSAEIIASELLASFLHSVQKSKDQNFLSSQRLFALSSNQKFKAQEKQISADLFQWLVTQDYNVQNRAIKNLVNMAENKNLDQSLRQLKRSTGLSAAIQSYEVVSTELLSLMKGQPEESFSGFEYHLAIGSCLQKDSLQNNFCADSKGQIFYNGAALGLSVAEQIRHWRWPLTYYSSNEKLPPWLQKNLRAYSKLFVIHSDLNSEKVLEIEKRGVEEFLFVHTDLSYHLIHGPSLSQALLSSHKKLSFKLAELKRINQWQSYDWNPNSLAYEPKGVYEGIQQFRIF